MKYNLILTENQCLAISSACDIVCRLMSGQWSQAVECCRDKNGENIFDYDLVKKIESIIKPEMGLNPDEYWGVGKYEDADILWDIHQVLRHRISWDLAIKQGLIENEESQRDWSTMRGVSFSEPMKFSKTEPLPEILKQ